VGLAYSRAHSLQQEKVESMPTDTPAEPAVQPINPLDPPQKLPKRGTVGAKALALLHMAQLGAPIPRGFVLPSELCGMPPKKGAPLPDALREGLKEGLRQLSGLSGKKFGDEKDPLLVSLRSSAADASDDGATTVVNIGLTPAGVAGLLGKAGDARQAWDAYRRFLQSFGTQVLGVKEEAFDSLLHAALEKAGVEEDHELDGKAMEALAKAYREQCSSENGGSVPDEPMEQLVLAVAAACGRGRSANGTPGPERALIVQEMVFGTGRENSGVGHYFTRHPRTGEKSPYGRFLECAAASDLTAGVRMPEELKAFAERYPEAYAQVQEWAGKMEKQFRDALEFQFTVERGQLCLLDARPAGRTPQASLKIALDLEQEGICDQQQALCLIDPFAIELLMHPVLDKESGDPPLAKGLPASPGSAVGQVVFFAEHVEDLAAQGKKSILVRNETTPEDIGGLKGAEGILTVHGGLTSHAAVVARGMGKCCVVGASAIEVNYLINEMTIGELTIKRNDWISLDGNTGEIFLGQLPQVQPSLEGDVAKVLKWADAARTMGVRANADTEEDAQRAVEMGAEGVGLCRTEHMFFDIERIPIFRKMILAVDEVGRAAALADLLPVQRKDFMDIFRVMDGRPVTIRLLDPPLNEFLPRGIRSQTRMSRAMKVPLETVQHRIEALSEHNPMLGHRGCRLAFTYPEIYQMQVRAIVEAACIVAKEGIAVEPEIMVPLVSTAKELEMLRTEIRELADRVMEELAEEVEIHIGTMVETPRAAICSRSIAPFADFYSFGTNDLTQMGYGFSRDDAGTFLPTYLEKGVLKEDPFVVLDWEGIGGLVRIAIEEGRKGNPALKVGICGEHGGEPKSVKFFHSLGLDYVSCSPFRLPIARVAAAQAALETKEG
jgi:pyruvate,orthophosphate dikinase